MRRLDGIGRRKKQRIWIENCNFVCYDINCFFSDVSPSLEFRNDNANRFRTGLSLSLSLLCLTAKNFQELSPMSYI